MNVEGMIAGLNQEIVRLIEARDALERLQGAERRGGRLKGSGAAASSMSTPSKGSRSVSEEGKRKIAEAQRKRWAVQKKSAKAAAVAAKSSGKIGDGSTVALAKPTAPAKAAAKKNAPAKRTVAKKQSVPVKKAATKSAVKQRTSQEAQPSDISSPAPEPGTAAVPETLAEQV